MKKILLFTNFFPYSNGETFLETEIKYLSLNFKEVDIATLSASDLSVKRKLPHNVNSHTPAFKNYKNKTELILRGLFNFSPIGPFVSEFFSKKVWKRKKHFYSLAISFLVGRALISSSEIKSLLKKTELDGNYILYFYWGNNAAWIIPLLKKNRNNKIIVRNHGTDLYENLHADYIPLKDEIIKKSTILSTISQHGLKYLSLRYPEYSSKFKLNHLGVEFRGLNSLNNSGEYTIVSCSGLVPIKRVNLIIETLKLIPDLKITWIHIGGGSLQFQLSNQATELPKNITSVFKGELNNETVLNIYVNTPIDLFINVSRSEGLPVSIMEAMSCGIPVFATDAGGTSELVNNKNGMIFPVNFSPQFLSEQIKQFLKSTVKQKDSYRLNAHETWKEKSDSKKNYTAFCKMISEM